MKPETSIRRRLKPGDTFAIGNRRYRYNGPKKPHCPQCGGAV